MRIPPVFISVVIPVYNRRDCLAEAIGSVLSQTLPPQEIIVVDDASHDGSHELARELSHEHPQITVLRHDFNQGGSAARNTGWRAATGELIAFLDSDDRWLPTKLERQAEAIQRDQSFGLAFCRYVGVSEAGRRSRFRRAPPTSPWDAFRHELAWRNAIGSASVPMVRREALEGAGGFDPAFPSCQDWELWYRLSRNWRFVAVDEVLVERALTSQGRISTTIDKVMAGHQMMYDLVRREHGGALPTSLEARHLVMTGNLHRRFGQFRESAGYIAKGFRTRPCGYALMSGVRLLAAIGLYHLRRDKPSIQR